MSQMTTIPPIAPSRALVPLKKPERPRSVMISVAAQDRLLTYPIIEQDRSAADAYAAAMALLHPRCLSRLVAVA